MAAEADQERAAHFVRVRVAGIQPGRPVVRGKRLPWAVHLLEQQAELVPPVRVFWIEADGLSVGLCGLAVAPRPEQGLAERLAPVGIVGVEADGLFVGLYGILVAAEARQGGAAPPVRVGAARVEPRGLFVRGKRLPVAPQGVEGGAAPLVGAGAFWVGAHILVALRKGRPAGGAAGRCARRCCPRTLGSVHARGHAARNLCRAVGGFGRAGRRMAGGRAGGGRAVLAACAPRGPLLHASYRRGGLDGGSRRRPALRRGGPACAVSTAGGGAAPLRCGPPAGSRRPLGIPAVLLPPWLRLSA